MLRAGGSALVQRAVFYRSAPALELCCLPVRSASRGFLVRVRVCTCSCGYSFGCSCEFSSCVQPRPVHVHPLGLHPGPPTRVPGPPAAAAARPGAAAALLRHIQHQHAEPRHRPGLACACASHFDANSNATGSVLILSCRGEGERLRARGDSSARGPRELWPGERLGQGRRGGRGRGETTRGDGRGGGRRARVHGRGDGHAHVRVRRVRPALQAAHPPPEALLQTHRWVRFHWWDCFLEKEVYFTGIIWFVGIRFS